MWLSKQMKVKEHPPGGANMGTVSVADPMPAVVTDGEARRLQILTPGGYCWRPTVGDAVLVIKDDGGSPCILGVSGESPVALSPGEVCLHAGGASIYLDRTGAIRLTGTVYLNGVPLQSGIAATGGTTNGE
jgi:hypothetical protein